MRTYFDFDLKGKQIFLPVFIAFLVMMGVVAVAGMSTYVDTQHAAVSPELLNWAYLGRIVGRMATMLAANIIIWVVSLYIMKAIVTSLSYKGERLEADYNAGKYVWLIIKGSLLTFITLGIYSPWFTVKLINFYAQNTSFRFHTFRFNGRGITLFAIIVLTIGLPYFIFFAGMALMASWSLAGSTGAFMGLVALVLFLAMFLLISLYYSLVYNWFFDFSFGPKRISTTAKIGEGMMFILGQVSLTIITLGLYLPMFYLRVYRYYVNRMVLGEDMVEDNFGFTMNAWRDYWYILGQSLLGTITLGIYLPWATAKIMTRVVTHTYVDVNEDPKVPMPADRTV